MMGSGVRKCREVERHVTIIIYNSLVTNHVVFREHSLLSLEIDHTNYRVPLTSTRAPLNLKVLVSA